MNKCNASTEAFSYILSDYIVILNHLIKEQMYRIALSRLRTNLHNLEIEGGRHYRLKKPMEAWLCSTCTLVEDEQHVQWMGKEGRIYIYHKISGIYFNFRHLNLSHTVHSWVKITTFYDLPVRLILCFSDTYSGIVCTCVNGSLVESLTVLRLCIFDIILVGFMCIVCHVCIHRNVFDICCALSENDEIKTINQSMDKKGDECRKNWLIVHVHHFVIL